MALGACGDNGGGENARFLPGNPRIGAGGLSGAADANCEQWRAGSFRQRQAVVEQIGVLTLRGNRPGQRGAKLPDDKAYDILDEACKADVARKIKLYKIYNRALAFGPLDR